MTIPHDLLGNRLNNFKNKKEESKVPEENNISLFNKYMLNTINSVIMIIVLVIKSVVYGYSLKIIFNTDWNFLGILCVGLSINFLKQFIYALVHKIS